MSAQPSPTPAGALSSRELLELGARAAGLDWHPKVLDGGRWEYAEALDTILYCGRDNELHRWDPRDSLHDAFMLMVDLRLQPFLGERTVCFVVNGQAIAEPYGDDKHAAVRLAILRAAAETQRLKEAAAI